MKIAILDEAESAVREPAEFMAEAACDLDIADAPCGF